MALWIPDEIDNIAEISAVETLLLAYIYSFQNNGKTCFASNSILKKKCKCSERTIRRAINHLLNLGFLEIGFTPYRSREFSVII